jgi:hypothetical protein
VAAGFLVVALGGWLYCVCIHESFYRVLIRTRSHQQFASLHMHQSILWVTQNEPLEVQKCKVVITKQICTTPAELVSL